MNCASGCWCVQRDYVEYVLSVVWCQQFKQACVGGGTWDGRKGKGRQRQSGKYARPGVMNSFPLSCVRGTSSEPITVVTRWQQAVFYGFWPPELSGCPSMLIKGENESARYGDTVRQKRLTRWSEKGQSSTLSLKWVCSFEVELSRQRFMLRPWLT